MILKTINCINCKKNFKLNKYLLFLSNHNICDDCYDINSIENVDNNYFKNIDKIEKAYILGLLFYSIKDTEVIIDNFRIRENTFLYRFLQKIGDDFKCLYSNTKCMFRLYFKINDNILDDINIQYKNFFNFDNNEFKLAFIRGYYECSLNNI